VFKEIIIYVEKCYSVRHMDHRATKKSIFVGKINSIIHIIDTEGIIIHKFRESCYETQMFYLCNGNMGITNCKTALVTKLYTTFLRLSTKNTEMVHN